MVNFKMRRLIAFAAVFVLLMGLWAWAAPGQTRELVPLGTTVGIKVEPGGLLVSKLDVVSAKGKSLCPARQAGLAAGDIILAANGVQTQSAAELEALLEECEGELVLEILRHGTVFETAAEPVMDDEGFFRLGVVLKESVEGIGTLTYYDPQTGGFGGLGHGIVDAGVLVPAKHGQICRARINSVKKGKRGAAGHLEGALSCECILGEVEKNCPQGIFGKGLDLSLTEGIKPMPTAKKDEVKQGEAVILSSPDGENVKAYEIEIVRINPGAEAVKEIEIKVTDKELIDLTGGIVQGMSGSVICQNGKIVGAVTHVLINDSTRGYGIFIENMLEAAG